VGCTALLAVNRGLDISNVQGMPFAERLEKPKLVECGVDKNEVIGITTWLREVFGEVTDCPGWWNGVDPN